MDNRGGGFTYVHCNTPPPQKPLSSYTTKEVVHKPPVYLPVVAAPQVKTRTKALSNTVTTNNGGRRVTRATSCVNKYIPTPRAFKTFEHKPHPHTYRLELTTGKNGVWAEEYIVEGVYVWVEER